MFCNMGIKTKGQIGAGVIQRTAGRRPEWDDGGHRGFPSSTQNGPFKVSVDHKGQRPLTFRELWTADSGG